MDGGKVNRSTEIRELLQQAIVEGRRKPGQRLDEQTLANEFGVSRTPVREALSKLVTIGLVEMRPRQGAVVRRLSVKVILGMMEVLGALESLAAGLAARRMTLQEQEELQAAHAASAKFVDPPNADGYEKANDRLHGLIYSGSRNEYLKERILEARRIMRIFRPSLFESPGRIRLSFAEHAKVVEAICASDDEEAERMMRLHISTGGHTFADLIAHLHSSVVEETLE